MTLLGHRVPGSYVSNSLLVAGHNHFLTTLDLRAIFAARCNTAARTLADIQNFTDAVGPDVPAKIGGGSGESAAKAAIEADGYKGAKVVRRGDNGIWYAKAMRGTTEVSLTVDAGGRVSLE